MLVLSRKIGEQVVIGDSITVTVVEVSGNRIRLGIQAPSHVRVLRSELSVEADDPVLAGKPDWSAAKPVVNRRRLRRCVPVA